MNGIGKLNQRVASRRGGKLWLSVEAFAEVLDFPLDDFQISLIVASIRRKAVVHISAMRKIGKTHILGFMCLFLASMGYTGVYTNHKKEYVEELFNFVLPYAEILKELGVVRRIQPASQHLNIYFSNGGEIKFRTRSSSFGRGGMKLDFVFFDEAQKVHEVTQTEISGTMKPSKLGLEIHVGNPATQKDLLEYPDSPFVKAKIEGRKNFIEFSAIDSYDPAMALTPELLADCNPNAHRLGDLKKMIESDIENGKSHEVIAAESYGVWNLPETFSKIEPYFSPKQIDAILTRKNSKADKWYLSVAIDWKSTEAHIVINDGIIMEHAGTIPIPRGSVEPVAEWILQHKNRFRKIFIMGTSKGTLLSKLLASIANRWELVSGAAFSVHLNRFIEQVEAGTLQVSDTDDVRAALGSFYIGVDKKTHSPTAMASNPEQVSLLMSLFLGALDQRALKRINGSTGVASQQNEFEEKEIPMSTEVAASVAEAPISKAVIHPEVEKLDPMAAKKRAQAEAKLRIAEKVSA